MIGVTNDKNRLCSGFLHEGYSHKSIKQLAKKWGFFNKCNTISSFSTRCCMTLRISLLLFCSQSFGAGWIPLWYWQWWWWGCNDSGDMQDLATLACLTRTVQPATGWVCVHHSVPWQITPRLNTRMGEVFWMNICVWWLCDEKKNKNQKNTCWAVQ